ncbi:MAG: hypothetical protein H6740_13410 [Alphaproteobacteria bacterium]|nr:hypothetical protein [Alphaproteobacteria bacterium]
MKTWPLLFLLPIALTGCAKDSADTGDVDKDGDGWTIADGDCDDDDASVYPGAPEESETDGWDQDCDGPGE